jgi:putative tryptophan/tyrosine transport system substrate-binding protein
MRRREFVTLVGSAAATWPLAARSQQPSIPLIGYLEGASQAQFSHLVPAFLKGLREIGYSEGRNVRIEYRWADGQYDRLPTLAAELVVGKVTLIFTTALISALAAKAATETIPIVFVSGPDPVQLGLVARLNRPGGNLTGVTLFTSAVAAKRLELLHELFPSNASCAFLLNPANTRAETDIRQMEIAANALSQKIVVMKAATDSFGSIFDARPDSEPSADRGRSIHSSTIGHDNLLHWLRTTESLRFTHYVVVGGLMSYGSSISDAYRQAGAYAGRILNGEKPGDLPIMQPTKFELIVNATVAQVTRRHHPIAAARHS